MKTHEAAKGRWLEILPQFGLDPLALDGRHHVCPCNGDGTDRFRFSDRDGSGSYFCQCSDGERGGLGLIMCKTGMEYRDVAARVDEMIGNNSETAAPRKQTYAESLRAKAVKTDRSAYLEGRGLEVPQGLDWCRSVTYYHDDKSKTQHPAMLAPVTRRGRFLTYHVTYLGKDGKADVPTPRKIMPGAEIRGGAVSLYPAAAVMGVGEGIETCIAAKMLFNTPTWAALNTALLRHFEPPPECTELWIFGDNDANWAGHAAAYHLANRLHGKIKVSMMFPETVGQDWNDVLRAKQNADKR